VPNDYWSDKAHQRAYLDWLAKKLDYSKPSDWYIIQLIFVIIFYNYQFYYIVEFERRYRVSISDFFLNHGSFLLVVPYKKNIFSLLNAVYPERKYLPWLFVNKPKGFFDDQPTRKAYIKWLRWITRVKDSTELRVQHFRKHGGVGLLQRYNFSPYLIHKSLEEATKIGGKTISYVPRKYWVRHFHLPLLAPFSHLCLSAFD